MPDADLAQRSDQQDNRPLIAGGWMAPLTFLKTFFTKLDRDECPMMASAIAFSFIGALIPGLIFMISLLGMAGLQQNMLPRIIRAIYIYSPPGIADLLKDTLHGIVDSSSNGLSLLGIVIAIWSASRGTTVIVQALDKAYNVPAEHRPFWYEPVMAIFMVLTLGMVLLLASNLIFFGEPLIDWAISAFHLPLDATLLLQCGRWGVGIASVIGFSTLVYGLLLKVKLKNYYWRASFVGSVVFTGLWVGISILFGFYIRYFNTYNPVYGALGALVILLTWLYLSAFSLLIAGEIISILAVPKEAAENAAKPET